ncbi:cortactin-binding protein 2 isoform X2 [Salvelinus fontinalis]|uniref:cortactin-binding protein 2 isoform X2 n=1 Tax=Salvelinus fontinalis TaxID=8038 RepID=UPI00248685AC|nr:cortactin-binding protein 2 isoform X2 [Salvelinus fontinalis]
MASEGASGEQPPPVQTLATTVLGSVEAKCEFNMDNLSKPELLTLLSIMEGELEARDLVIEALRARRKEVFLQERYGHFSLTDPFLALQRDFDSVPGVDKERRPVGSSPIAVLEAVMAHCRKMQERMSAELEAAESRQKRLQLEKLQLQSLEQEHRKLTAQLKDEREKNKHIVMMLVRECKQLATRVVEESQRFDEISARLDDEGRSAGRLQEELTAERQRGQQLEAKMEKQLSELDTEREQLRARLGREETESLSLRRLVEQLRTEQGGKDGQDVEDGKDDKRVSAQPGAAAVDPTAATNTPPPKPTVSVAVATDPVISRTASCQTDPGPPEAEGQKKPSPLTIPVKPTPTNYAGLSLPKTPSAGRGLVHSSSGGLPQTGENGAEGQTPHGGLHSPAPTPALPTGVSPRVQAARYKFQEQDQNGTASHSSPPSRDLSPTNRDNFAAKQQARHTVTQVLSRFTSPPAGGPSALRPGLPHSTSEGGPFPGRLGHPIGLKSPTVARIDRGNPPPIPPKKPGLSQTPSPPHPPIKVVGDSSRSPGVGLKPATPQLPPKPALDLVPALTASQVGACPPARGPHQAACAECPPTSAAITVSSPSSINPSSSTSAPSRSPRAPGSPLATASGWCPSIVPSLTCGGPVALDDGRPLLLQAASQGNVTLLSMLLNRDPTDNISHLEDHPTSALFSAAQNGHTDCVKLLLTSGVSADVSDENGFTPLHFAAAFGHHRCVEALVSGGADVDHGAVGGQTPLFVASGAGRLDCTRALLNAGADRSRSTTDSCTALHAAVSSGHVDTLRLLLCHPPPDHTHHDPDHSHSSEHSPGPAMVPILSSTLLNQANCEGWTAAHIAAARGFKDCLEVLCSHSDQDIERRDKWNRTIHDVATDDCKDLLENLYSYRVLVCVQSSGSGEPMCPLEVLKDGVCVSVLGGVCIHRATRWAELNYALAQALTSHLQLLCGDTNTHQHTNQPTRDDTHQHTHLGLTPASMASILIGDTVWLPGQELPLSPWDLVRKPLSQHITIRLKGLSESCLDELALESLIPLQLLQNYVRLVEQYRNIIFHGLEGSCQEYLANQISRCIKTKQEVLGVACDIIRVEVDRSLTKQQLLDTFITCGFLVPVGGVSLCSGRVGRCVVVVLEGLEKAHSLTELLGDLCEGLENRGTAYLLHGHMGPHLFQEGGFLIGTLSKSRLKGSELRLQQHFRWVTLRWDSEPLHGLLGRHLRRKLLHKTQGGGSGQAPEGLLERTVCWVSCVWQQLNACLSRLGTHEALLGPQLFLSCPVVPNNTQAIVKWLARLWNMVVVPRVEESIVSRVTVKRSSGQRVSPSNLCLSSGQQAVVKAALSILLNKAVLQGCPLPRHEIDRHLLEFQGGTFPLAAIGSCKGSGGRKGRDSGMWRRANTSPRKKGSPTSNWTCGGSLREGSLSNTDVRFITNGNAPSVVDVDPVSLSLCSDDETDLIRELQTMCSSKSEPDISKIARSKEDFIVFSGSPSGQSPLRKTDHEATARPQTTGSRHSTPSPAPGSPAPSNERRSASRPKSQLPVPSSRGPQPRANSSSTAPRTPTMSANRNATRTEPSSSKTRQAPTRHNNNNNVNENNQQHEDIWILHQDLHENNNNMK